MVILDSNILLYAHVSTFAQHEATKAWLEEFLSEGQQTVGMLWQVAASFLRISTNGRVFQTPLELDFAIDRLNDLLNHTLVSQIGPTRDHWLTYSRILKDYNLAGDDVMDARIVAIAVEHGAAIATTDKGFRRFADVVKIIDPVTPGRLKK
jgi:toxin-antitoxin system PIN domain toxin